MLKNLFNPNPTNAVVDVPLDPRPGVDAMTPAEINRYLDGEVEVIDLGAQKRDEVIQPTTWHAQ